MTRDLSRQLLKSLYKRAIVYEGYNTPVVKVQALLFAIKEAGLSEAEEEWLLLKLDPKAGKFKEFDSDLLVRFQDIEEALAAVC